MHVPKERTTHITAFDGSVVDHWLEWKLAQTAGSIHDARCTKPLQQSALLPELRQTLHYVAKQTKGTWDMRHEDNVKERNLEQKQEDNIWNWTISLNYSFLKGT